jgi:hypothetical protein
MAPNSNNGGTRASTAKAAAGVIAATKAKGTPDPLVTDVDTAMEYLIVGELKSEDDELSFEFLSVIAMQLSQQSRFSQPASDAFRALSYLIHDLQQKRTVGEIADAVAKAVSAATKRVRDELEEATELVSAAAVTSTNTAEELREECHNVVTELKDAMECFTTSLANTETILERVGQQGEGRGGGGTYADSVRRHVPSLHATVVARAELQKRKIRLIKASGMVEAGMDLLTEKQLVEKANMALGLMEVVDEGKPYEMKVVGAAKERGAGGVTFELNSVEAVVWLKNKDMMSEFLSKMGSTADFKEQVYEVVMDWVPVTFEVDLAAAWKGVEQANGLQTSAIKEAKWIKPTHLRSAGQRTAIAIFSFATREDANQVIENGLYVEGKKVWGRKQMQEPRRCLKCQCFGEHKAAQCESTHDVCGRCGGEHRTNTCVVKDRDSMECSNCKTTGSGKQKGHGAADRRCPIFLGRVDRMNRVRKENNYKYFCTTDPATWETNSGNFEGDQYASDSQGYGGDPPRQDGARGRLGGGYRGEGGGGMQGGVDKGWGGVNADTRAGGNKDYGSSQTVTTSHGGAQGVASGSKAQVAAAAIRIYRPETQRGQVSAAQTTLTDLWTQPRGTNAVSGARSWSEDVAWRERESQKDSQQSALSYV